MRLRSHRRSGTNVRSSSCNAVLAISIEGGAVDMDRAQSTHLTCEGVCRISVHPKHASTVAATIDDIQPVVGCELGRYQNLVGSQANADGARVFPHAFGFNAALIAPFSRVQI